MYIPSYFRTTQDIKTKITPCWRAGDDTDWINYERARIHQDMLDLKTRRPYQIPHSEPFGETIDDCPKRTYVMKNKITPCWKTEDGNNWTDYDKALAHQAMLDLEAVYMCNTPHLETFREWIEYFRANLELTQHIFKGEGK